MVEDDLVNSLTLEQVMKEYDVVNEFISDDTNLGEDDLLKTPTENDIIVNVDYEFRIKKNNSLFITFRWNKLRHMDMGSMIRIKHIHDDYLIVIK